MNTIQGLNRTLQFMKRIANVLSGFYDSTVTRISCDYVTLTGGFNFSEDNLTNVKLQQRIRATFVEWYDHMNAFM